MKKKVLLIGNNDGLPGVKKDLINFKNFFKSSKGGEWYDKEIIELLNPTKSALEFQLLLLKIEKLDYFFVVFSGHGGLKRETFLELNPKGELISENAFDNIATRQVTFLDCCRASMESVNESINAVKLFRDGGNLKSTRVKFENRILNALPQHLRLYSCEKEEYSHDTPKGGAFTKNFLEVANNNTEEYIYFGRTHQIAAVLTTNEYPKQHPEIIQPRLLTTQQLILGIN